MPEGHTIHRLARTLHQHFAGERVQATSPQGRFSEGAARLDGRTIVRSDAKGKHAFVHFDGGDVLHVHLGLFGRTRFFRSPAKEPRGAVRLRLASEGRTFDLVGPNRCEILDERGHRAALRRLGPDPLRPEARLAQLRERLNRTRRAIGAVLLDQSVVAGIGNVYRAELLFLSGLDPRTPANQLAPETVATLWRNTRTLLRIGVEHNQIRVVGERGLRGPRGAEKTDANWLVKGRWGLKKDRLWVYKRRNCKVCGEAIVSEELANRTLYSCPACQVGRQ